MILVTCAVEAELDFLAPRDDVATLVTGVGPVEAACSVTAALAQRPYRLLINAGIAGAFGDTPRIGDGVAVKDDSMEIGLEDGAPLALPNGERVICTARSDERLVTGLDAAGFRVVRGITVSLVTATTTTARRLASELRAEIETMEGFAALRAAERCGVPAMEVRGISNRCGARQTSGWDFKAGRDGLRRILGALMELL
ncbi:MAG: futalosine hydrolase [Candidatus Eremiobacteraeota bacterium]|nr:futalosine hydrolase [Candidatus Eremiobacteraeota bacterium]MBV9057421.1 futalosine hydrolase [Candidatus Eremiobacteraeota bacterium]MBV9699486.1 futalosine hydrolase [Candidatus Eremiobacteraeota bacterium]